MEDRRSDEQLLAEHAAGAPGGFDELVRRYTTALYGFVARYVGVGPAAEDLIQEVFVQVHSSASSFDVSRRFKPWLYTIAANKARDYLRSRRRRGEQSLDDGGADDSEGLGASVASNAVTAEEVIDTRDRAALVRLLIDRMPDHLRTILLLGYYQQLPYAEIAEALEIPVGTVKSRLHAAVTHFSRLWEDYAATRRVNVESGN